jgi:hypothetical protein
LSLVPTPALFRFDNLKSVEHLCWAFGCSPQVLQLVTTQPKVYCQPIALSRRRRSKRPRIVWSVSDPLRRLQRQVALWLKPEARTQHECVTGFRPRATPFENAKRHADQEVVVVADLADFYGTITLVDVLALFESLGAAREAAVVLARLSTLDEKLVQGGRASPYIANLVARRLDDEILRNKTVSCRYTRYVDDLAFSGLSQDVPSQALLEDWIRKAGFRIRIGSFKRSTREGGPYVTGLYVGGKTPQAPRHLRRRVERFLRFAEKFDIETAAEKTFSWDAATALKYVVGVAHWMSVIDENLSNGWLERVTGLTSADDLL